MKDIIKKAIEDSGLSQKELAEQIYVSPQAVSDWVRGNKQPTFDNIKLMTEIFGEEFGSKMLRKGLRDKKIMKKEPAELKDLSTFEKAQTEAKNIMDSIGVNNYSHAACVLLNWAVTCAIGLTYHWLINKKNKEETQYEDLYYYLNNLIEEDGKDFEHDFFLLGGDLFESFGEYKIPDHDYAYAVNDLWFKFKAAIKNAKETNLYSEFKVALLEVILKNSYLNNESR